MATATTATGRVPTETETGSDLEAIAAAWVEAKNDEKAAGKVKKAATDRRTAAGRNLIDAGMAHGQTVNVTETVERDGIRVEVTSGYVLEVQDNEQIVASAVLAALRVERPDLAGAIDRLEADPVNRTAYRKVALKRELV